jgi:hypothetical protein
MQISLHPQPITVAVPGVLQAPLGTAFLEGWKLLMASLKLNTDPIFAFVMNAIN